MSNKDFERMRRKMAVQDGQRTRREAAARAMASVMSTFVGQTAEQLAPRIGGNIEQRKIEEGGRTYTVLVDVVPTGFIPGAVDVNFQVDDGGLHMEAPQSGSVTVRLGESFPAQE